MRRCTATRPTRRWKKPSAGKARPAARSTNSYQPIVDRLRAVPGKKVLEYRFGLTQRPEGVRVLRRQRVGARRAGRGHRAAGRAARSSPTTRPASVSSTATRRASVRHGGLRVVAVGTRTSARPTCGYKVISSTVRNLREHEQSSTSTKSLQSACIVWRMHQTTTTGRLGPVGCAKRGVPWANPYASTAVNKLTLVRQRGSEDNA
jgi:hypothetical protein